MKRKYEKPQIEAYHIGNMIYFRHKKSCQCKTCIEKWVDADPYYGINEQIK